MSLTPPGTKDSKNYNIPGGSFTASLDCGSGANLLPKGIAAQVCADLNGTVIPNSGNMCTVDCSVRQKAGGLKFGLNGKDILVPYDNLINEQTFEGSEFEGRTTCLVMVGDSQLVTDPPTYLLGGESFLRIGVWTALSLTW
jgi:hypothetical protein